MQIQLWNNMLLGQWHKSATATYCHIWHNCVFPFKIRYILQHIAWVPASCMQWIIVWRVFNAACMLYFGKGHIPYLLYTLVLIIYVKTTTVVKHQFGIYNTMVTLKNKTYWNLIVLFQLIFGSLSLLLCLSFNVPAQWFLQFDIFIWHCTYTLNLLAVIY